ncbi:hypothetical protein GCM10020219_067120 [Nonomuraea dietziae]
MANEVWSNSPAASRVARHSSRTAGDHTRPAQPSGLPSLPLSLSGTAAAGSAGGASKSNQFTRSHPAFSPNEARRSACLGQAGERRNGLAAVRSSPG